MWKIKYFLFDIIYFHVLPLSTSYHNAGGKVKHELRITSYKFRYASYGFRFTSYEFKSTSYEVKSTSYLLKSTKYEFKSKS